MLACVIAAPLEFTCNVTDVTSVRGTSARACVQTDMHQAGLEERRREKERARVRRDKLQAARDIDFRAEAANLSAELKPTAEELAGAAALRAQVRPCPPGAAPFVCAPRQEGGGREC